MGRSTVEVCFEKKVSFVLKCWNVVDWLICQLVGGLCMVRPCVVEGKATVEVVSSYETS